MAPRKRPFHSIIAGFVMKDGAPLMTFGNMGGTVQPETHAQHMVNLIDLGMNVQMTTDAARFTHDQTTNLLRLEQGLFDRLGGARSRRWATTSAPSTAPRWAATRASSSPAIRGCRRPTFDRRWADEDRPVNGVYRAGSDHRKDGQAAGW